MAKYMSNYGKVYVKLWSNNLLSKLTNHLSIPHKPAKRDILKKTFSLLVSFFRWYENHTRMTSVESTSTNFNQRS